MNTSSEPLRLALWQALGHGADVEANLEALHASAREARASGAHLLVTPEMYVTGYNVGSELARVVDQRLLHRIAEIAQEEGIALAVGTGLPLGERITNSVVLIDADGSVLTRYNKTQLFGDLDRSLFVEGEHLEPVVEWRGIKLGFLICYDVEFPESVRALADAGAQLVLVPTAQMHPFEFVAEHLIRVRAWENQIFVAYVNRVGSEGELDYVGRSSLAAPNGDVIAAAGSGGEGLLIVEVDPLLSEEGQRLNPYLSDRRKRLGLSAEPTHAVATEATAAPLGRS